MISEIVLYHTKLRGGQSLLRKCFVSLLDIHIGIVELKGAIVAKETEYAKVLRQKRIHEVCIVGILGGADGPYSPGNFRNGQ